VPAHNKCPSAWSPRILFLAETRILFLAETSTGSDFSQDLVVLTRESWFDDDGADDRSCRHLVQKQDVALVLNLVVRY
jgi:hypothetical protein